jgi:uncharacterized membrane protein YfhO
MKLFLRILPILILTTLVTIFFLPLFWPIPQIFITPDSNLSDILHFHYPLKRLLSDALQKNSLPLWTDLIGTGFPPIGESQIQAFSLINLVLFKFFPLITAFNLQYVIIFLVLSVGMYLVARELEWSKINGLFCAIIFTFSGLHIVKIPHLNCLQGLSYVPFIFLIILKMQKNKKTRLWVVLPFLLSQQILQSHYQYVFMTYLFLSTYIYLFWWRTTIYDRSFIIKKILLIGAISLGLASIQLAPSLEYFMKSSGRENLSRNVLGSFHFQHLLQFFSPYILGDNRVGTYPASTYGLGFLETFSYIGVVPLILALLSLFYIRKNSWIRNWWIICILFFLFVFEKNSPIYFLFAFPPFSWFRVHSRFLALISLILVLCAGFVFDQLEQRWGKRHIIILFIFCASIFDVLSFASSYQPTLPIDSVEAVPEFFKHITSEYRVTTVPSSSYPWYRYMYTYGWKTPEEYLYFLNDAKPNYTIIHGVANTSLYAGYLPVKQSQLLSLALNSSEFNEKTKIATISSEALATLRLHNTGILISPYTITNTDVSLTNQSIPNNSRLEPLFLYTISQVKPKYYITDNYKQIRFYEEYYEEVKKTDALEKYEAFITTDRTPTQSNTKGIITVGDDSSTKKTFSISTPTNTFFVASLYLYPGWNAELDGKPTPIVPANLIGMGIYIPNGKHTLILRFVPKSLYIGACISFVTLLLYIFVIIRSVGRRKLC